MVSIVYKVKCKSCPFTYIGKSKRSWNSRGSEHKLCTCRENFSAIKQHAETTDHDIHSKYIKSKKKSIHKLRQRQFLESWHSEADKIINSTKVADNGRKFNFKLFSACVPFFTILSF